MLATKIEHFLRFGDAADHRPGKTVPTHDEAERGDPQRLRGSANEREIAIDAE